MRKLLVGGMVAGALVFGGGVGYLVTDTVADSKAEEVKADYQESAEVVRESLRQHREQVTQCQKYVDMSGEFLVEFEEYLIESSAYISEEYPGFALDQSTAVATRALNDRYQNATWMSDFATNKELCMNE